MPFLAIYRIAKPAMATRLGLGFSPCSSPKHAFFPHIYKDREQALRL
jgi:hypothetical protein